MAANVQTIVTAAKAIAATYLGATWKEMRFTMQPEKNDTRAAYKCYGIRPLAAENVESVTGYYTLDHRFELMLGSTLARNQDDDDTLTVFFDLYTKSDEIYQLFVPKMGLSEVLLVTEPSISEPEIIESGLALLRTQFLVRYRNTIP